MSLTQEQIKKISIMLSKIRSNEEKLEKNINNILDYMKLLEEINTDGVEGTISVVERENFLRNDEEKREIKQSELLACSKQKVIGGQIAISNIMK